MSALEFQPWPKIGAALGAITLAGLMLAGCSGSEPAPPADPLGTYKGEKTDCTVTDKQAIGRTDEDGRNTTDYRVFSSCGTFAVQDDPFIGQWNSADTFGSIQVDKTYNFEAYGWRNGLFSTFPNIKNAIEVAR